MKTVSFLEFNISYFCETLCEMLAPVGYQHAIKCITNQIQNVKMGSVGRYVRIYKLYKYVVLPKKNAELLLRVNKESSCNNVYFLKYPDPPSRQNPRQKCPNSGIECPATLKLLNMM